MTEGERRSRLDGEAQISKAPIAALPRLLSQALEAQKVRSHKKEVSIATERLGAWPARDTALRARENRDRVAAREELRCALAVAEKAPADEPRSHRLERLRALLPRVRELLSPTEGLALRRSLQHLARL